MMNKKPEDYKERFYREWQGNSDLVKQEIIAGETDLLVLADIYIKEAAEKIVQRYRKEVEDYIKIHPQFKTSLKPMEMDPSAPLIIQDMLRSSGLAGVGPMAGVAGALSEFVGKELLTHSKQIIVENGGDIFIAASLERKVGIFAGESVLTNKLFLKIKPEDTPLGICTSSGTVGHSLSFGKADACVIISNYTSLADAVATAGCNRVNTGSDIEPVLEYCLSIDGVKGALIICGKDFGASGDIELI